MFSILIEFFLYFIISLKTTDTVKTISVYISVNFNVRVEDNELSLFYFYFLFSFLFSYFELWIKI